MRHLFVAAFTAGLALTLHPRTAAAQTEVTVRIPSAVKANDQVLPAGSYRVRLSGEALPPARGQTPDSEQWVELRQNGAVKAKVGATVVKADQVNQIAKGPMPAAGQARVEVLKGKEYVRIWINRGGNNYLIHLPAAAKS